MVQYYRSIGTFVPSEGTLVFIMGQDKIIVQRFIIEKINLHEKSRNYK